MDNKNVFVAIALSMSVLLFWSAFFPPPEPTKKTNTEIKEKNSSTRAWPPGERTTIRDRGCTPTRKKKHAFVVNII